MNESLSSCSNLEPVSSPRHAHQITALCDSFHIAHTASQEFVAFAKLLSRLCQSRPPTLLTNFNSPQCPTAIGRATPFQWRTRRCWKQHIATRAATENFFRIARETIFDIALALTFGGDRRSVFALPATLPTPTCLLATPRFALFTSSVLPVGFLLRRAPSALGGEMLRLFLPALCSVDALSTAVTRKGISWLERTLAALKETNTLPCPWSVLI